MRWIAVIAVLGLSGCLGRGGQKLAPCGDASLPASMALPASVETLRSPTTAQVLAVATDPTATGRASPQTPASQLARPVQQASASEPADPTSADGPLPAARIHAVARPPEEIGQPGALALQDAIQISLFQNPDLVALRQQEGISVAATEVAATYPWNPFMQTQYFPSPRTRQGTTEGPNYYIWIMQTLELAHQRSWREQNANAALNMVRWNIHQAELLNIAQTERLFFTAVYQRQLLSLASEVMELNERILGILERRFEAGQTTAANVTMAKVAARSSRRQADLALANYRTALLALRQQLKLHPSQPLDVKGDLSRWRWLPVGRWESDNESLPESLAFERVAQELAAGRPDVLAAQSDANAAFANYRLARANMVPNLAAGPIYDQDEAGTQFWGFRTQVNLPVFDTGGPLARQRLAEVNQRQVAWQQLQERAAIEAYAAIDRYERARRIVEAGRSDFSADIPAELRQMESQYQAGQADLLNVVATQVSLVQDYRAHLDILNEVAQAAANVTAATGLPPHMVVEMD